MSLKSGLQLASNEKLVFEIEAELWAVGDGPIQRLIGLVLKLFYFICGQRVKAFLVITDKRVVEVATRVFFYCIPVEKRVSYVLPSSVKEIGWKKSPTICCFCPMYKLYYQGHTACTEIQLKDVDDEAGAMKIANAFYSAINAAQ